MTNRTFFSIGLWMFMVCFFSGSLTAQTINQAKPWLGVAIDQGKTGVLVKQALAETPAEKAGIKAGDEIFKIETQKVSKPEDLIKAVQTLGVGQSVTVHFLRNGKKETRTLELVARPEELELVKKRLLNKPAPHFELPVVHGNNPGNLSQAKGKVVVLEFWATWCPACVASHGRLSTFAKEHDIPVYAISDEETKTLQAYAKKHKPSFTILSDTEQKTMAEWMVTAIPMLAVIDQNGITQHLAIGSGKYLEEALQIAVKLNDEKKKK